MMNIQKGFLYISNGRADDHSLENITEPVTTGTFERPCMWAANEIGLKLYEGLSCTNAPQIVCSDFEITFYNQHIYRNVFNIKDIWIGYKYLCRFLEEHPDIKVIHCNTPIGGVLGRICGKKYGKKVIYMAHGFHFYKGAPLLNRTLFKFIEKWMARKTDCLITINQEDYEVAQTFKLNNGGKVYKVNGVGMDLTSFKGINVNREEKRNKLGLSINTTVGIVVGDLNDNKNVETIIKALGLTKDDIHIIICGLGPNEKDLKLLAKKCEVDDRCHFLGFRTDVKELYMISDMFLFASQREGLPRSTMEAMLAGLPCVVSNIRGNVDLIEDSKGGRLIAPKDYEAFAKAMTELASRPNLRNLYGEYNKKKIRQFDYEVVKLQMLEIYKEVI